MVKKTTAIRKHSFGLLFLIKISYQLLKCFPSPGKYTKVNVQRSKWQMKLNIAVFIALYEVANILLIGPK